MRVAGLGATQGVDASVERFAGLDVDQDLGVRALEGDLVADAVRIARGVDGGVVSYRQTADHGRRR